MSMSSSVHGNSSLHDRKYSILLFYLVQNTQKQHVYHSWRRRRLHTAADVQFDDLKRQQARRSTASTIAGRHQHYGAESRSAHSEHDHSGRTKCAHQRPAAVVRHDVRFALVAATDGHDVEQQLCGQHVAQQPLRLQSAVGSLENGAGARVADESGLSAAERCAAVGVHVAVQCQRIWFASRIGAQVDRQ